MNPSTPDVTTQSWKDADKRISDALEVIQGFVNEVANETSANLRNKQLFSADVMSTILGKITHALDPRVDEPRDMGTCVESANGTKAIRVFPASADPELCWYIESGVLLKWADLTQPVQIAKRNADHEVARLTPMVAHLQGEVQRLTESVVTAEQNRDYSDQAHRSVVARQDMIVKAIGEVETMLNNGQVGQASNRIVQLRADMAE
jgi:hypothetical protein